MHKKNKQINFLKKKTIKIKFMKGEKANNYIFLKNKLLIKNNNLIKI